MAKSIIRWVTTPLIPALIYLPFHEMSNQYYLDIGGAILPWIIAALAGASVTIVMYWRKIKAFFTGRFKKRKSMENDDDAAEQ